jgi:hypothetical protein
MFCTTLPAGRKRLPNRRVAETFSFEQLGLGYIWGGVR